MNSIPGDIKGTMSQRTVFGFRAELEQILDFLNYKENPNLTDFFGTTLLHFAVTDHYDNFEMIEKLIKAGAYVNARNDARQTPLHLAVLHYNWRVIDTLVAYGADTNVQDSMGNSALHLCLKILWGKRRDQREMLLRIAKKLLHYRADFNIPNSVGETPLMIAAKYGDLDIIKDMLDLGANVYLNNRLSETCLHLVSKRPQPDVAILKELLKRGACVNCYDHRGRTALDNLLCCHEDGHGRQLAESFIMIATLVNWNRKIDFRLGSQYPEEIASLQEFMDGCYKEVSRMKSYIYSDESNLCHFAINGGKVGKKTDSQIIFEEVLDTLTKEDFPIYADLIEAHFDTTFLKKKLFELSIYARNAKGEIHLHPYAFSDITTYLSISDLLNLVRAYSKPFNNPTRNDKIDCVC